MEWATQRRALRVALIGLFLGFAASTAIAQVTPAFGDQFAALGGIKLGTLNLSDLVRRFGPADIVASGERDDYQAAVCYRVNGGLLYLMSNNLGGSEHRLLGYKVVAASPGAHCAAITKGAAPALEAAGLHLGISTGDYDRLMHSHASSFDERGADPFSGVRTPVALPPRAASDDENIYFFRNVSVEGTFANGLLVGFEVWLIGPG